MNTKLHAYYKARFIKNSFFITNIQSELLKVKEDKGRSFRVFFYDSELIYFHSAEGISFDINKQRDCVTKAPLPISILQFPKARNYYYHTDHI